MNTAGSVLLFMDQNQLNNLRNIAQAAHNLEANRIARETAAATSELLRSQEQQRVLEQQRVAAEQQRVAIDYQRLQEEQRRTELAAQEQQRRIQLAETEANEKKALTERVKSIRGKMAAMEEEISDFHSSLSKTDGNPSLTGGGAVATYLFLLLQTKLEKLVVHKSDLHELSDIRFMGQQEKSVRELAQTFPDFCGDTAVKKALHHLGDLIGWPSRSVNHDGRQITPSQLVNDVRKACVGFLETFENSETKVESLAVITQLFSEITAKEQLLRDAEASFVKEWTGVELLIQDLQSFGIGPVEVQELVGVTFPCLIEQTDPIARLHEVLKACRRGLAEASKCWDNDNVAIQQTYRHLAEGRFNEAQEAIACLQGRNWGDIDSRSVQKEFENTVDRELKRLVAEADKLTECDPFEAVRRLQVRATENVRLEPVFSELLLRRKALLSALETRLLAEITQIEAEAPQKAVVHGDMILKAAKGLPEIEPKLFDKVEAIRVAIKRHELRRKEKFAVGMLAASVILGAVAGVATFVPGLRWLEYVLNASAALALQGSHAIPVFGGLCVVFLIFQIVQITGLRKQGAETLSDGKKAVRRSRFDLENNQLSVKGVSPSGGNTARSYVKKVSKETLSSIRIAIWDEVNFKRIPGSSFLMGADDENDAPVRMVEISTFEIASTTVTFAEWTAVLDWASKNGYKFQSQGRGAGDLYPVTHVNWYDVVKWCNAKSEKDGLVPCYEVKGLTYRKGREESVGCNWNASGYRLPTEAEWEKAARGGLVGKRYPNGDILSGIANFHRSRIQEVGKYAANGYGLYDMAGNVWEWCWDWYGDYSADEYSNPKGPRTGDYRVMRGGCWGRAPDHCRVSYRHFSMPDGNSSRDRLGFRLVRGFKGGTHA